MIAGWVKIFGGMFWYFVVSHPISARSCFSAIFAARVVWFFFFARWVTLETIQVLFLAPQFSHRSVEAIDQQHVWSVSREFLVAGE